MKITNISMKKVESDTRLKAIVSIEFDHCFVVNDIKILDGNKKTEGLFIAMPSRKQQDGTFKDIAHPINSETREMIQKAIIDKYYEDEK